MDRARATAFIDQLQNAQQELYGGGGTDPVRRLLDPDIVWHVPGESPIAGCYEGPEEVIAYMLRRRDLADGTFGMRRREELLAECRLLPFDQAQFDAIWGAGRS